MADDTDKADPAASSRGSSPESSSAPAAGYAGRGYVETPPPEAIYAGMWTCYRDGVRTVAGLSKRTGVSMKMAFTAIKRGWPSQEWAALEGRAKFFDRQVGAARDRALREDVEAAKTSGKTEAARWRERQVKADGMVDQLDRILVAFGAKLEQAAKAATFVKFRRGKDGQTEPYVDAAAFAKGMAHYAAAVKDYPAVAKFILGPAANAPEPQMPDLTPEQIDELAAGRLPEGVDTRTVGMMLVAAAGNFDGGET